MEKDIILRAEDLYQLNLALTNILDSSQSELAMIINKSGIAIRLAASKISVLGRATMGVRLINLSRKNDEIASITKVASSESIGIDDNENQGTEDDNSPQETND